MFERFTEQARQVVVLSQEEGRALGHHFVGAEHILLGLLREDDTIAARVLAALGVTLEPVRARVLDIVGVGEAVTAGQFPFTPRAKKVLEIALREALSLGHQYIGPEHILLALSRDGGVATQILQETWNLHPEAIRGAVIEALPVGLIPADRGAPVPAVERVQRSVGGVQVVPSLPLGRLLMVAAALALDDGRTDIDIDDVWLALTREPTAMRLASELGIDEHVVQEAIRRRDAAIE